jgi:hypothetical protein
MSDVSEVLEVSESSQVTASPLELSREQKNELIMTHEIGSRTLPVLNTPVPENCKEGYGTWSPIKTECVTCAHVSMCFCRATDTPAKLIEQAKATNARRTRAKEGKSVNIESQNSSTPKAEKNPLNPFRRGSSKHSVRAVILAMAKEGITTTDDDAIHAYAEKLGVPLDRAKNSSMHVLYEYDKSLWPLEKASEEAKPLHGLIWYKLSDGETPDHAKNNSYELDATAIVKLLG